jgi:hypothetical protein
MLWHYTVRLPSHLGQIVEAGVIRREGEVGRTDRTIQVPPVPCVWFSRRQDFEPTACKVVSNRLGGLQAARQDENRLIAARIGVADDIAPVTWAMYKQQVKRHPTVDRKERRTWDEKFWDMEANGRMARADPADWFASLEPVARDCWQAIQICLSAKWVDVAPEDVAAQLFTSDDLDAERARQYPAAT